MKPYTKEDVACKCGCGLDAANPDLLIKLNAMKEFTGWRPEVNSGTRCPAHNAAVGGVQGSAHLFGHAVDLACENSQQRLSLVNSALYAGFTRVGIGRDFLHLDVSPTLPQGVMFLY
jgi:zinc D-Ala-D-Ala carboxypeptidase